MPSPMQIAPPPAKASPTKALQRATPANQRNLVEKSSRDRSAPFDDALTRAAKPADATNTANAQTKPADTAAKSSRPSRSQKNAKATKKQPADQSAQAASGDAHRADPAIADATATTQDAPAESSDVETNIDSGADIDTDTDTAAQIDSVDPSASAPQQAPADLLAEESALAASSSAAQQPASTDQPQTAEVSDVASTATRPKRPLAIANRAAARQAQPVEPVESSSAEPLDQASDESQPSPTTAPTPQQPAAATRVRPQQDDPAQPDVITQAVDAAPLSSEATDDDVTDVPAAAKSPVLREIGQRAPAKTQGFLAASASSRPAVVDDPAARRSALQQQSADGSDLPDVPFQLVDLVEPDRSTSPDVKPATAAASDAISLLSADAVTPTTAPSAHPAPVASSPQPAPAAPAEQQFAIDNHDRIVAAVRSNLLPNGGSMQIRLDPPELGALQISINLRDGVMNASFETSNDQATRLLSHSLSQLKSVLESQGISVDKLHVQQSPHNESSNNSSSDEHRQQHDQQTSDSSARREQQRRELLRRMWRRLTEGSDPLDMVA